MFYSFIEPYPQHCGPARKQIFVSHSVIGTSVWALEGLCVAVGSVAGQVIFQQAAYHNLKALDFSVGLGAIACAIYMLLAAMLGLYQLPLLLSAVRSLPKIALAWAGSILLVATILFALKVFPASSRGALFSSCVCTLFLLVNARLAVRYVSKVMISKGAIAGRPAIVIGENSELPRWSALQLMLHFGVAELGRVSLRSTDFAGQNFNLEQLDKAIEMARERGAAELLIAVQWSSVKLLETVRNHLRMVPLSVRLVPDHFMQSVMSVRSASHFAVMPSIELQRPPLSATECMFKRSLDLLCSLVAILALFPLLALVAFIIKIDSPGPIIFKQRRAGFNGRHFMIYKFRSMSVLEDGAKIVQARRNDPRVTRIGRILRQTSIDELPQLFNVLKGDMSLVGPRPHALAHDDEYKVLIENYAGRHHVKPGLTGWAQVHGYRGETQRIEQMASRVEFDLWYINNWSLSLDLQILLKTFGSLSRNYAY
jgi:undecaprenyl-phosphate galactose phosphotransferase/putative colanic acid biosynthesis UDP-glucose lipid carrier transferase